MEGGEHTRELAGGNTVSLPAHTQGQGSGWLAQLARRAACALPAPLTSKHVDLGAEGVRELQAEAARPAGREAPRQGIGRGGYVLSR